MTQKNPSDSSAPKRPPRINLSTIFRRKQQIAEAPEVLDFLRTTVRGDRFETFAVAVHAQLPKYVPFRHVYDSMLHLAGHEVKVRDLDLLAWRLAANLPKLRYRAIGSTWSGQSSYEWAPVHVVSVDPANNRKGEPGATLALLVLAGEATGEVLYKFWSARYSSFVAELLGFSKPWHERPYLEIVQLFGLRFSVRLSPDLSKARPEFDQLDVTSSQRKFNITLLKKRQRGVAPCPAKLPTGVDCHRCAHGVDFCPAATHLRTFVQRPCLLCSQTGWFDPERPGRSICISCRQVQLAKERKLLRGKVAVEKAQ